MPTPEPPPSATFAVLAPRFARLVAALAALLVATACPTPTGDGDPDDAGVDAGPQDPCDGVCPPYERDEGFFTDEGMADEPWRCGMAPYRWWGTSDLGSIVVDELKHEWTVDFLSGIQGQLEGSVALAREPALPVNLHRVLYTTQDKGQLLEATALIALPDVAAPTELPVLAYMHGTVGFSDDCSPSRGIDSILSPNYFTAALIGLMASWGYIVVAPDYVGLKSLGTPSPDLHPYFVAEPTALSSLDAIRAGLGLVGTAAPNLTPGPVLVMGVSQGGHAAAFTVRYAPHYAPELEVAGAAYSVPPLDLVAESEAALAAPTPTTQGNAALILVTADSWYQSAPGRLDEVLSAEAQDLIVDWAYGECQLPGLSGSPEAIFTEALLSGEAEPWRCYGEESSLVSTSVPRLDDTPALVVLAEDDGLVNTPVERTSVTRLCEEGMPLQFLECAGADHTGGFLLALDDIFDFLDARLAGDPLPAGACDITPPRQCSSDPG